MNRDIPQLEIDTMMPQRAFREACCIGLAIGGGFVGFVFWVGWCVMGALA